MSNTFSVSVRDQATLQKGVNLPHDCCAGQCGACKVELVHGITLGGEAGCGNILACEAGVFSDLEVTSHDAPAPVLRKDVVESIRALSPVI